MSTAQPKYPRVLLKLSGEALAGEAKYGIDPQIVSRLAAEVAEVHASGCEVAIVVGGGNIFRGLSAADLGMDLSLIHISEPTRPY